MYSSFYAAARGVIAQQQKLDVTANNLANINNYGYKNKSVSFSNLMYYNMNNQYGQDTAMKAGTGVKVEMTNTDFTPEAYTETDGAYDLRSEEKDFQTGQSVQRRGDLYAEWTFQSIPAGKSVLSGQ